MVKTGQSWSELVRTVRDRWGQSGKVMTGEVRIGVVMTGRDRPDQTRPRQVMADQDGSGQVRTGKKKLTNSK